MKNVVLFPVYLVLTLSSYPSLYCQDAQGPARARARGPGARLRGAAQREPRERDEAARGHAQGADSAAGQAVPAAEAAAHAGQRGRKIDEREIDRQIDGERGRQTERDIDRRKIQIDGERERQTERQADRRRGRQIDGERDRQTERQADRRRGRQIDGERDRQTESPKQEQRELILVM